MAGQRAEAERVLAENLPPEEVRQVLDSVTGTHTARGLAPDRRELNRATTQASLSRGDPVPADVVQPIPARAMAAPPSGPPPEVVRPRPAEAQERGSAETGMQVAQPVDPVAAAAANQRALSAPLRAVDVPAAAFAAPVAVPVAPAAVAVPAPVVAARAVERPAGGMAVQFAAAPSQEAAQAFWLDLVQRFPDMLGQRAPLVIRFQLNGTVFWRLRTDGFQSVEDAQSLCARMRAGGQDCFVARS